MKVVFAITLGEDGSPSEAARRLPPPDPKRPYTLRFILPAGSEALCNCRLRTNYPLDGNRFIAVDFMYDYITDGFCEFQIERCGPFEYFVEYRRDNDHHMKKSKLTGYFLVDPTLVISCDIDAHQKDCEPHILNMDSICLLTVVPKWLGKISTWKPHFQRFAATGYNMIHFVPLQQRGASNSPYSIYDQLDYADDIFDAKLSASEKVARLKQELRAYENMGILSLTDVVWNHTAHNSKWLREHPESGYNLLNSPHLTPAYELDEAILMFSRDIASVYKCTPQLSCETDLQNVMHAFKTEVLPQLALWEFYTIDVKGHLAELDAFLGLKSHTRLQKEPDYSKVDLTRLSTKELAALVREDGVIVSQIGKRFGKLVSSEYAVFLLSKIFKHINFDSLLDSDKFQVLSYYRKLLDEVNLEYYQEYDRDMIVMIENVSGRVKYERLAAHGPRLGAISAECPLVSTYFTRLDSAECVGCDSKLLVLANNGWIWNADPLIDFAGPNSKSYLIREVIPWGDCVKLRYGNSPKDNPWLWRHMEEYTMSLADMFVGFRIDNCHSTPIHVAQYFLDKARVVRPNLYVVAELFTGSEERDIRFVSKLGINSLIREAMSAWSSAELSRYIHRYGGQPVGSMALRADYLPLELVGHQHIDVKQSKVEKFDKPVEWYDSTTDSSFTSLPVPDLDESGRKTPLSIRSGTPKPMTVPQGQSDDLDVYVVLRHVLHIDPQQELDAEIVFPIRGSMPHALFMDCTHDNETPHMKRTPEDTLTTAALVAMTDSAVGSVKGYDELVPLHLNIVNEVRKYDIAGENTGIMKAKQVLLYLHYVMGQKGYTEIHVHQEKEFIMVHRQNSFTHHGYVLIANTSFTKHAEVDISPITLRNTEFKTVIAGRLNVMPEMFIQDPELITGSPCQLEISYDKPLEGMVSITTGVDALGTFVNIIPKKFPSGSILLLETNLHEDACQSLFSFRKCMNLTSHGAWYLDGIVRTDVPELQECFQDLSIVEMNVILYRCDAEERDMTDGNGVYNIPDYGPLPYAGLQGFASLLRKISTTNDLGHPLCAHLRSGFWALDYIVQRLERYIPHYPKLKKIRDWLTYRFNLLKRLPNFLIPKYFNVIVMTVHREAQNYCLSMMSVYVKNGSKYTRGLALGLVQFYGKVQSTGLSPLENIPSLAAGLPHFSTQHMRCWGRDIFISLRGLCLITGQYQVARSHILYFGACVRHGLIPNLLDSGRKPRYNARDAVWWFLQAVQDYCIKSPEGLSILDAVIKRRFASDAFCDINDPTAFDNENTLKEIIYEIMEKHARGIHFTEWNAGKNLDHAMRNEGFNIDAELDEETGFIFGGNRWNCGTWMDKMGESVKANTFGVPATPRDGAAIELVGLLKSTVRWLSELASKGNFPESVSIKGGRKLSFEQWNAKIQDNFERHFYIPESIEQDCHFVIDSKVVNRRGIYKDSFRSSLHYTDYQLRPNVPIAMVVAPELFTRERAKKALEITKQVLLGPLGMKTLDPSDWAYRGDYDSSLDTDDPSVSKGFNYHQGPEWLWPVGFFLRAYYNFHKDWNLIHSIHHALQHHKKVLMDVNPYGGLPELTNSNGKFCASSCLTQAWSMATFLDLVGDMRDEVSKADQ